MALPDTLLPNRNALAASFSIRKLFTGHPVLYPDICMNLANQIAPEIDQGKRFRVERPGLPSSARYRIANVAYGTYMVHSGAFIENSNVHIEEDANGLVSLDLFSEWTWTVSIILCSGFQND